MMKALYENRDSNRSARMAFCQEETLSQLETIQGYSFTPREIDIVACILSGKSAKKIAGFLSISPKTVENHIRNIMLKLGCRSQESVIEFIESSGKFLLIKQHYSNLLIQSMFEIELRKILSDNEISRYKKTISVIYDENQRSINNIIFELQKHLEFLGVRVLTKACRLDGILNEELDGMTNELLKMSLSSDVDLVVCLIPVGFLEEIELDKENLEKVIFLASVGSAISMICRKAGDLKSSNLTCGQNYYFLFFELLKKLNLGSNFDKNINEFRKKYESICMSNNISGSVIKKTATKKNIVFLSLKNFFQKNWVKVIFISFAFFLIYLLHVKFLKNKDEIHNIKEQNSLKMKTENESLKRPYSLASQIESGILSNWNLPRQDHVFVGRNYFLSELDEKLDPKPVLKLINRRRLLSTSLDDSNMPAIVACVGLGGIGKTQLALQYIHHTRHRYVLKAWFSAENTEILKQQFFEFAKQLGYSTDTEPKKALESSVVYVKKWLGQHNNVLLVFDNVSNYEDISDFLPEQGTSAVLITSRSQLWPEKIQILPIDVMSKEEAISLVNKITGKQDPNVDSFVERLGFLPLALAQGSAYIGYNKISVKEYLNLYDQYQQEMLSNPIFPKGVEHEVVAVTWNVSLETIEKTAKNVHVRNLARVFLTASSYLAPENISVNVLRKWLELSYPEIPRVELLTHELLTELHHYSLLKLCEKGQTFTLHRLVQTVMRNQHQALKVGNAFYPLLTQAWYENLLNSVNFEFKLRTKPLEDEIRQINLLPHLQALLTHYERLPAVQKNTTAFGRVFFNIGNIFLRTGEAKAAKPYYEKALAIQKENSGKDSLEVANTLTNLGDTCRALGGGKQARVFLEGALGIFEQYYGKNHIELVSTLANLGCAYGTLGEDKKAKSILIRALRITENSLDKDSPKVAEILTKLADISTSLGEDMEGKKYAERALSIKEHHYGKGHFSTAIALTMLGCAHSALKEYDMAILNLEKALKIQENYFQKDDREIAITLMYLGRSYFQKGHFEKAMNLLKRSLDFFEVDLDSDKYYQVIALTFLGETYSYLKKPEKGKELLEKALQISKSFFAPSHPQIGESTLKLAEIYVRMQKLGEARPLAERSYAILFNSLGSEHILTKEAFQVLQKCESNA